MSVLAARAPAAGAGGSVFPGRRPPAARAAGLEVSGPGRRQRHPGRPAAGQRGRRGDPHALAPVAHRLGRVAAEPGGVIRWAAERGRSSSRTTTTPEPLRPDAVGALQAWPPTCRVRRIGEQDPRARAAARAVRTARPPDQADGRGQGRGRPRLARPGADRVRRLRRRGEFDRHLRRMPRSTGGGVTRCCALDGYLPWRSDRISGPPAPGHLAAAAPGRGGGRRRGPPGRGRPGRVGRTGARSGPGGLIFGYATVSETPSPRAVWLARLIGGR